MSPAVLIVDDDTALGEMLRCRLLRHGWSAEARTSAADALAFLEQESPDVIITDIDMPGMSGLELCRRVRAGNRGIPVVVTTALGGLDTALDALRAGAWEFVTKPFDVEQILVTLERAAGLTSPAPPRVLAPAARSAVLTVPDSDGLESIEHLVDAGRSARGLLHDLGTPLNVVLGHAQLLGSEELTPAEVRTSARAIVEQAQRMTRLLQRVLVAGATGGERAITRVEQIVAGAIASVAPLAMRRGIEIVVATGAGATVVDGNSKRLQRVLEHLLTNGLQAMDGAGHLRVSVERARAPLREEKVVDTVSIAVEDSGCGIPLPHREKLFRSFFTTKRESGGAGLGLMVCQHVVRAHGGTIAVDSTPGQGSRFVIHLPAVDPERTDPGHA